MGYGDYHPRKGQVTQIAPNASMIAIQTRILGLLCTCIVTGTDPEARRSTDVALIPTAAKAARVIAERTFILDRT